VAGATGLLLLTAFCACAVSFDVRMGRIPNILNALGFLAGVTASLAVWGLSGILRSLSGTILGAALLIPFFMLHMVGGGDIKFLAAAGSIVGWRLLGLSFLLGAAFGGAAGIAILLKRGGGIRGLRARLVLLEAQGLGRGALMAGSGLTDFAMHYSLPLSLGLVCVYAAAVIG
jgi:Flp pilus assembly protein protease CpaA